ncbi:MAG: acetyl-CoA acetyltransferase [Anaerolineaceae bacterium]
MKDRVGIIGVGWSGFYPTSPDRSYRELIYEAASRAYNNAGVDPRRDIDSFITLAEDFHEGTSIFDEYTPDQIGAALKPVHTITGDGIHGLATAAMLLLTGQSHIIAVEAHSKASNMLTEAEINAYAQDPVNNRPLRLNSHFIAGMEMRRYLYETGTTPEQCADVVVKNRANALNNPSAPYGGNFTISEILSGNPLASPLSHHECAHFADGAIVFVLASEKLALALSSKPIWILGVGWCNDSPSLEYRNWSQLPYITKSAQMAYRQSGINNPIRAIDFAEVDDLFAYKELQSLEAMGFIQPGEAGALTMEGYTNPSGEFPVNVSGGCLGEGNLLDANGLARVLEIVLQLRGEAGQRQLQNVEIGLAQSWRGLPTTSGAVIILGV